jgi:hypothetical protein
MLLAASVATYREQGRERAVELASALDWENLAGRLRARRLLHTLGPRIVDLAGDRAEADFGLELAEALSAGRRQGAFLQMIATRVMEDLSEAGIASVPLKGPQLSEALYGDPGRRPSADIDLLVAPDRLGAAVETVRAMGYRPPSDPVDGRGLPMLHFALTHERGELPPVELHWRVHWYEERFARERLLEGGHTRGRALGAVEDLLALLLFYARDGFVDLRLATDVGAWWDAFGEHLPPQALEETVRAYPELDRVARAAAAVAQRVVGLPSERILSERPLDRRARIAARLANPHPHSSQAQVYADMGLIDGLLAPRGGLPAFVRRQIVPLRSVIDGETHTPHQGGSAFLRGARVIGRYGLALARLIVSPKEPRPAGSR